MFVAGGGKDEDTNYQKVVISHYSKTFEGNSKASYAYIDNGSGGKINADCKCLDGKYPNLHSTTYWTSFKEAGA